MTRYILSLDNESELSLNPNDDDTGWKLYSFSPKHVSYRNPNDFFPEDPTDELTEFQQEIRTKLEKGLAFVCSYYEHGNCVWSLERKGERFDFDSVRVAGILVGDEEVLGEGVPGLRKDAESFLTRYTAWCNGEVYGYTVERQEDRKEACPHCHGEIVHQDDGEITYVTGGAGYIGDEVRAMAEDIRDLELGENVEIQGDAKWLADHFDFEQSRREHAKLVSGLDTSIVASSEEA